MKYRKKPVVIDAVQWFKDGDHSAVEPRHAEILYDRGGKYYYITHIDPELPWPTAWIAIDPQSETAQKHGYYLPFSFYELKSGNRAPLDSNPELYARYAVEMKWGTRPRHMGYVKTLEGGHIVTPGDWIITGVKGEHYPCKPDIFEATYEPAE